jgi:hypothetical protein
VVFGFGCGGVGMSEMSNDPSEPISIIDEEEEVGGILGRWLTQRRGVVGGGSGGQWRLSAGRVEVFISDKLK